MQEGTLRGFRGAVKEREAVLGVFVLQAADQPAGEGTVSSQGPHWQGCHPMLDAIAELCFGATVEFDRPLTDAGRGLMNALGVNVVYTRPKYTPQREVDVE